MFVAMNCPQCGAPAGLGEERLNSQEIQDSGVYDFVCEKGHKTATQLHFQRHELLFEIGVHAIVDGYNREAVTSFSASLERYFEFFLTASGITNGVPVEAFKSAWKRISQQSERQLGAYIFTHLLVCHRLPQLLPDRLVALRNNVVHKGYVPTQNEAIEFGKVVMEIINAGLAQLESTQQGALNELTRQALCGEDGKKTFDMTIIPQSIVGRLNPSTDAPGCALESHIAQIRKSGNLFTPPK